MRIIKTKKSLSFYQIEKEFFLYQKKKFYFNIETHLSFMCDLMFISVNVIKKVKFFDKKCRKEENLKKLAIIEFEIFFVIETFCLNFKLYNFFFSVLID